MALSNALEQTLQERAPANLQTLAFIPQKHQEALGWSLLWVSDIRHSLIFLNDPAALSLKLKWWQQEVQSASQAAAQHPYTQALAQCDQLRPESWIKLLKIAETLTDPGQSHLDLSQFEAQWLAMECKIQGLEQPDQSFFKKLLDTLLLEQGLTQQRHLARQGRRFFSHNVLPFSPADWQDLQHQALDQHIKLMIDQQLRHQKSLFQHVCPIAFRHSLLRARLAQLRLKQWHQHGLSAYNGLRDQPWKTLFKLWLTARKCRD